MEKAYDVKALGGMVIERCKAQGLPIAEEAVEKLLACVFDASKQWLTESAQLSASPADNLVVQVLAYFETQIMAQIEKIDLDGDGD